LLGGHALKGVSGEVQLATVRRSDNSVRHQRD